MAVSKMLRSLLGAFSNWCLYILLLSSLFGSVDSQRTYMRTCDCEYVVDGKCAYTLLLPLNKGALPEQSCPQHPYPDQSTPSSGQNTTHIHNQVDNLASNVTSLHNKMLEQSHMLNQLQSVLISLKLNEGVPRDQNQNITNYKNSTDNRNNIKNLTSSVEELKLQLSSFQETTITLDGDMVHLRESVSLLSAQVGTLQGVSESFQSFMDVNKPLLEKVRSEINQMKELGIYCYKKGFMAGRLKDNSTKQNANITVSSEFNDFHGKDKVNIYTDDVPGAWCPREPNTPGQEWIQFDLGRVRTVYGIVTRGRSDYEQWVETYMVYHSAEMNPMDTQWIPIKDMLDLDTMIFNGNKNQNSPKYNYFDNTIQARYVRIIPLSANGENNMCMRADVIGCVEEPTLL